MQTFSGEDLEREKRKGLQHEQMRLLHTHTHNLCLRITFFRDWLSQQMEEKKRLSMEKKKADHLYDMKAIEIDERAQELVKADEITRRTLNVAIKEYNQALVKLILVYTISKLLSSLLMYRLKKEKLINIRV